MGSRELGFELRAYMDGIVNERLEICTKSTFQCVWMKYPHDLISPQWSAFIGPLTFQPCLVLASKPWADWFPALTKVMVSCCQLRPYMIVSKIPLSAPLTIKKASIQTQDTSFDGCYVFKVDTWFPSRQKIMSPFIKEDRLTFLSIKKGRTFYY